MPLNSKQQSRASVEAALDWAYRHNYSYAMQAADDYCNLTGRKVKVEIISLVYGGEKLTFSD